MTVGSASTAGSPRRTVTAGAGDDTRNFVTKEAISGDNTTAAALHKALSTKFTRAACPHPTLPDTRLRADVLATPVHNLL